VVCMLAMLHVVLGFHLVNMCMKERVCSAALLTSASGVAPLSFSYLGNWTFLSLQSQWSL
jgi:hypothetical protein